MTTFIIHTSTGCKCPIDADTPDAARKIFKDLLKTGEIITKIKVQRS